MADQVFTTTDDSGAKTTTTVTNTKFNNGVIDLSIIPFIKEMEIDFIASGMCPDAEHWFYFDDVDVYKYVVLPNIIKLTATKAYRDLQANTIPDRLISLNSSNQATVLLNQTDSNTSQTILYVSNTLGRFAPGSTVTARGLSGTIREYFHFSGLAGGGTGNTVILAADAAYTPNNYWGTDATNTIFLAAGTGLGQFAYISAYNNVSRTLTLTNTLTTTASTNTRYSIGYAQTDEFGFFAGTFMLPNYSNQRFKTGNRIFRMMDYQYNDPLNCTSRADYLFEALGLRQTVNQITIRDITKITLPPPTPIDPPPPPNPPPPPPIVDPPHPPIWPRPVTEFDHPWSIDPLAQTFFVPAADFPNGIFLTSVDLFFKTKDSHTLPVHIEIRPTVNGFPHSTAILTDSVVSLGPNKVNTSNAPNVSNASTATTFTFRSPLHLPVGEYALVVISRSMEYSAYVAELGQPRIGNQRIVSEQPYVGSLFKSQNSSTWDASQLEDLMFVLRRAVFTPSGTLVMKNSTPSRGVPVDSIYSHADDRVYPNTAIAYTHSLDSGSTFENYDIDSHDVPDNRVNITALGDYQLQAVMTTNDTAISPVIHPKKFTTLAIENIINNANITNTHIIVTDGGSGYAASANIALLFSDGAGNTDPVIAYAIADASGIVDYTIVTNGGNRFIQDMTVTPASGNATFNFSSEEDPVGGPARAKYISRIVNLAIDTAGDLRLFLTANKPTGTDIKVYYKIRDHIDAETFDQKRYTLMFQVTPDSVISVDEEEMLEYEYKGSNTADQISYTNSQDVTYRTFNQFAIKIVLLSDNTTKFPTVYDMRAIALPGVE